jgi:hypothetical protein
MPYEILVRFCVTDDAIAAALGVTSHKIEAGGPSNRSVAVAFAYGLQCAADNGELPDCWFAVEEESVVVCDAEAWVKEHLNKDPKKLVADVIDMLGRGMYVSSYESEMLAKLRDAHSLLESYSK